MSSSTPSKPWRRRMLRFPPVGAGLRLLENAVVPRGAATLTVAMFHRTHDPKLFAEQLETLLQGRVAVRGAQVVAALRGGPACPAGALWITFDDAYGDFADVAWPVLEARGLPATQFVPTAYVGSDPAGFWWERLEHAMQQSSAGSIAWPDGAGAPQRFDLSGGSAARARAYKAARAAVKRLPHAEGMALVDQLLADLDQQTVRPDCRVLGWSELESLHQRGLEIGVHTRHHPMLDRLSPEAAQAEIAAGFADLQERFDDVLPVLAYPSGQYDRSVIEATRAAGIEVALTVKNGINRLSRVDPMQLLRVPIGPYADAAAVRLRLLMAR